MAHAWNGCSQSSRFPTAGQGERSSGNEIGTTADCNQLFSFCAWPEQKMCFRYAVVVAPVVVLKVSSRRNDRLPLRQKIDDTAEGTIAGNEIALLKSLVEQLKLTCDQASLIFFVAVGRYAWYNYLTICLLLVQNLDFSLIGQETKRYLELSHDWLPFWRYDFR